VVAPAQKREAVRFLVEAHRLPLRRSCACVGLSRSAWYAPPLDWTVRDAELIAALSEAVCERPSRGFWKCSDLLRRRRPDWNSKRIYRVYKAMKLNLRRPAKRRLPKRERVPLYVPRLPDSEALHIEVDTSINSQRLIRVFERLQRERGLPQALRTDNGPEFLGEAFVAWAKSQGMVIQYIQPGKPNQNAYIERFNRTFREEVLDPHLFARLDDVREAAWWWMLDYNEERPHDALGGMTPTERKAQAAEGSRNALSA